MTYLEFTTRSGAEYVYDLDNSRVLRHGPHSWGIDYEKVPDDEWSDVLNDPDITEGQNAKFLLAQGKFRITTPVVSVETVEEDAS